MHNSPQLETAQMSINRRMDWEIVKNAYNRIGHSSKNKQTIDVHIQKNGWTLQTLSIMKSSHKIHLLYGSIYMKFLNRQNDVDGNWIVITSAYGLLTRKRQAGNSWGIGNVYNLIWVAVTWVYIHMKKISWTKHLRCVHLYCE